MSSSAPPSTSPRARAAPLCAALPAPFSPAAAAPPVADAAAPFPLGAAPERAAPAVSVAPACRCSLASSVAALRAPPFPLAARDKLRGGGVCHRVGKAQVAGGGVGGVQVTVLRLPCHDEERVVAGLPQAEEEGEDGGILVPRRALRHKAFKLSLRARGAGEARVTRLGLAPLCQCGGERIGTPWIVSRGRRRRHARLARMAGG